MLQLASKVYTEAAVKPHVLLSNAMSTMLPALILFNASQVPQTQEGHLRHWMRFSCGISHHIV